MVSSALLRAFVQEPSISPNEQLDSLCARQDISASQFGFCPWYPRRFFGPSFKSLRFLRTNSRIHYVLAKILEHDFGFCPWYPRRFFGPLSKPFGLPSVYSARLRDCPRGTQENHNTLFSKTRSSLRPLAIDVRIVRMCIVILLPISW